MNRLWLLCLGLATTSGFFALGCGESDRPPSRQAGGAGGTSSSGGKGGGSGSGSGGTGGGLPGAPVVTIVSPAELASPNDGQVVVGTQVDVLCTATTSTDPGAQEVDPTSVDIELLDAEGKRVGEIAQGATTDTPGEYQATFTWTEADIPGGPISFRCSATDSSTTPIVGSDTNATFVDYGPTVTILNPLADSAHALLGAVPFEFKVAPAPLADADQGAAIGEVTLEIAGVPIQANQAAASTYTASVDFTDNAVFPDKPTGRIPVVVIAKNVRAPDPVPRTSSYSFDLDGTGPVITVTSPKNLAVVGGEVTLIFKVEDLLSGVENTSVVVSLNGVPHQFQPVDPWLEKNGEFRFTFDTRTVTGSIVQLSINIEAKDKVGNASLGQAHTLHLDNVPPIVDMDPGNVRERKKPNPLAYCSNSFDPLGPDAANDQQTIPNLTEFRAIVWDRTNSILGQQIFYYARTDDKSVRLYLQPAVNTPLLVDTNADTVCDDLATPAGLPFQDLSAVPAQGTAHFGAETTLPPALENCGPQAQSAPTLLCQQAADVTRIIKHEIVVTPEERVIYGLGDLSGLACTGGAWEVSTFAAEGWMCMAVRARDLVGNVGISPPLRVCLDDQNAANGTPNCTNPPSCTDGCSLPPRFDAQIVDL